MTAAGSDSGFLTVADLRASIGSSEVLRSVSFQASRNQITTIVGRNGAGKTTTLRCVLGLIPSRGHIQLAGTEIAGLPTHKIVRRKVGYVPEDRDIFRGLTVQENLRLAERANEEHRYDMIFDLFPELRRLMRQLAGSLSGGEQQMLSLSRALLNPNDLLLIDEPTKGLAPRLVGEVVHVLERVRDLTTILLVEQNLTVARKLADRAVVMIDGSTVSSGPGGDVLHDESTVRTALGVG
jgi:branched-chain amino acid transport system ATP-binding protein